jgi:hypothetical protein
MEPLIINPAFNRRIFVVDNFYADPYAVRDFALKQEFFADLRYYKGKRTHQRFAAPGTKEMFENIIGEPIQIWNEWGVNGCFQTCVSEDTLVYHVDQQRWAAMVYLTPDAPFETGTTLYAHKETKVRYPQNDYEFGRAFSAGFYDSTKFEPVDVVGNVFNRLVIFNSKCIHAASKYFGANLEDSRLFHMFFFD